MNTLHKSTESATLQTTAICKQAEEIALEKAAQSLEGIETLSPEEIRQRFHELQVHQIRLEMQNEELRRTLVELDAVLGRYLDIYNLAPVGFMTISEKGLILEANPTAATLLGTPQSGLVKQQLSRFILEEDRDIYYHHRKHLFETGQPQMCELRFLKKDGTTLWVQLSAYASQDPEGEWVCRCMLSDITERKLAEKVLRESEERYRTVADFTYDWECWIAPDRRFIYCSSSCERITGYRAEEFEKDPDLLRAITHPDDQDQFLHHMNSLTNPDTGPHEIEARIFARSGEVCWVSHICRTVYGSDGTFLGRRACNRDITERKHREEEMSRLQAQFQQAQKMESVGRLAGGVAHDFNNMLGIILGYAELALDKVDPGQSLHSNLEEIRKAANRSADLTRQLLAFARKQVIAPSVLDLNETVEGMLNMLRRLIGEDIDLAWLPGAGLWPVKVDPSQIDQILANLCVNARDAIAGEGKVTVETENVAFDAAYCAAHVGFITGEYVLLAVSDNGCGMDKEMLAHIFEPFFTTKGVGQGTGLGLSTVYGAVKQNNGFLNVYSEPGQGTTCKIYLPRHVGKDEQIQKKEGPAEPIRHGYETILLVEDEPELLEMIKLMLEMQGYAVLAASAPGEAIRLAEVHSGEIHLLMTDVIMPEMNGRDLARNLQSLYPKIRRLFMSGYTANVIAHHGILDPGVNFIQKPFSIKDLAAKVRKALGNEAFSR